MTEFKPLEYVAAVVLFGVIVAWVAAMFVVRLRAKAWRYQLRRTRSAEHAA